MIGTKHFLAKLTRDKTNGKIHRVFPCLQRRTGGWLKPFSPRDKCQSIPSRTLLWKNAFIAFAAFATLAFAGGGPGGRSLRMPSSSNTDWIDPTPGFVLNTGFPGTENVSSIATDQNARPTLAALTALLPELGLNVNKLPAPTGWCLPLRFTVPRDSCLQRPPQAVGNLPNMINVSRGVPIVKNALGQVLGRDGYVERTLQ